MTAGGMAQLELYQGPMIPMEVNPSGPEVLPSITE